MLPEIKAMHKTISQNQSAKGRSITYGADVAEEGDGLIAAVARALLAHVADLLL
jgi:hypothetical protein